MGKSYKNALLKPAVKGEIKGPRRFGTTHSSQLGNKMIPNNSVFVYNLPPHASRRDIWNFLRKWGREY